MAGVKYDTEKILNLMKVLEIDEKEAREVIEYDYMVDHAKTKDVLRYDISKEQQKVAKAMTNIGTRAKKSPTIYKFDKDKPKNRKPNQIKADLIQYLYEKLINYNVDKTEIVNKEGKISFTIEDKNFSLTLTQHRK